MYTYQINEIYDSTYGHYIVMIIRLGVMSHLFFLREILCTTVSSYSRIVLLLKQYHNYFYYGSIENVLHTCV